MPRLSICLCSILVLFACRNTLAQSGPRLPGTRQASEQKVAEAIYSNGLKNDWQDYGWAPRRKAKDGAQALNLSDYGGWIIAKPGLEGAFGGLLFRFHAPKEWGDFLEVRFDSERASTFPRLKVGPEHRVDLDGGWSEVFLSAAELNPRNEYYDRIVVRAHRRIGKDEVKLNQLSLVAPLPGQSTVPAGVRIGEAPPAQGALTIDCRAPGRPISPLIYGIAFSPMREYQDRHQYLVGATARRWGGNITSRYNWELGNAWNTAADWFFRNVNYTDRPEYTYEFFLNDNLKANLKTALTVPMLGWVAKDLGSASFPVSEYGQQEEVDPDRGDAGNGKDRRGKNLKSPSPKRTSIEAPPEFVERWIKRIRAKDKERGRSVHMYILDNEPMLWHDTHRDVHPEPLSYDELLKRTIAYGTVVRKADPEAVIAGPAEWGWSNYFYSAVDLQAGTTLRPDRRKHGDVPLIPWYLQQLRAHEKKTGTKLLDVLDVHFYPQAKGMGLGEDGRTDAASAALRIRSTRALWDPAYKDESWINENVMLLPRLQQWVDENYPGLGISIGEWNFGAEGHMSGGLAVAETLGRFGQHGLTSAFYWKFPAKDSPAFWGFRAYRNYDGKGGRFLDRSLPTKSPSGTSLFASTNDAKDKVVAVALNLDPQAVMKASLDLQGCGQVQSARVFQYTGGKSGFSPLTGDDVTLVPYSIHVIELTLKK